MWVGVGKLFQNASCVNTRPVWNCQRFKLCCKEPFILLLVASKHTAEYQGCSTCSPELPACFRVADWLTQIFLAVFETTWQLTGDYGGLLKIFHSYILRPSKSEDVLPQVLAHLQPREIQWFTPLAWGQNPKGDVREVGWFCRTNFRGEGQNGKAS